MAVWNSNSLSIYKYCLMIICTLAEQQFQSILVQCGKNNAINHPFGNMVYTTYLCWSGGWLIVVFPHHHHFNKRKHLSMKTSNRKPQSTSKELRHAPMLPRFCICTRAHCTVTTKRVSASISNFSWQWETYYLDHLYWFISVNFADVSLPLDKTWYNIRIHQQTFLFSRAGGARWILENPLRTRKDGKIA